MSAGERIGERHLRWSRLVLYLAALGLGAVGAEVTMPPQQPQAPAPRAWSASSEHIAAATPSPAALDADPVPPSPEPSDDAERASPAAAPAPAHVPITDDSLTTTLGAAFKHGRIITGTTPHRLILFTFDDGPDQRTTPLLLDRLDDAGIKAVFFLVASRLGNGTPIEREQSMLAREIMRRGHIVGGHTFDHVQLPLLSDAAIEDQLKRSDENFQRIFGTWPALIRPPFGAHSQRVDQILAAHGYTIVLWNLGAGDFQVRSADEVYDIWKKVFERRERENGDRGGIILLHDTYAWSVDAFQRIVSDLMARNCELLDKGEELFDFVDDPSFFYVARDGAPAETEAPPARLAPEVLEQRQAPLRERTARRCKSMASAY
jgi:peptidoglycan/xylan/chitin deacetylase (PgdA/CDA1 family)